MNAVWIKGLLHEKNIHVLFQYRPVPRQDTELRLAASNLYRLSINGTMVGYGPARAAHGYSRMDCYDLSPWAGQQITVSVEVYSAHVNTFYTVDEPPFFAAELRQGGYLLAEAANFTAYRLTDRVQKVRRFSYQRAFTEVYRMHSDPLLPLLGRPRGLVPAETVPVPMNTLLPRRVSYPTLERQDGALTAFGSVTCEGTPRPWRDRSNRLVDNVHYLGFRPSEQEADPSVEPSCFRFQPQPGEAPVVSGPMTYRLYDFARTLTGFFALTVTARTETTLYILFDEVPDPARSDRPVNPFRNSCCNILQYTLDPGTYHLQSFEANSARYAAVVVARGEAAVEACSMVKYENPDAADFRWDCGDEELNAIVQAAAHTFAQNAVDVLTDCPSRERAGWLCDSYFSGRAEAFFTGDSRVERSFLENYALYRTRSGLPAGMLPMCYPADFSDGCYIPNWSMWYILELKNYVARTGDEALRTLSRDKVLGLVEFFQKYENEYGLLENLESWVFVEWSKCNDPAYTCGVNYPSNMLWAAALDAAADLYELPALRDKAAAMRAQIRALAWNGTFFEDNAVRDDSGRLVKTGHTTETCQYYAFYFGIAHRDSHPALFEQMRTVFGPRRDASAVFPTVYPSNAIVGNYLRLEILLRYGYDAQVLQECRDFFAGMAACTGTLWEHSTLSASLNHGFASVAAVYIDTCVKRLQA